MSRKDDRRPLDVLVIGAGMAGSVAALAAAEREATLAVLEKSPFVGGASRISNGLIWGAKDMDTARELNPDGHWELYETSVGSYRENVEWLQEKGIDLGPYLEGLYHGIGVGYRATGGGAGLAEGLAEALRAHAVPVHHKTPVVRLSRDKLLEVYNATDAHGVTWSAKAIVVATGGFQANRHMLIEFYGQGGSTLLLRSTPESVGDGLQFARALGGGSTLGDGFFYGHLVPSLGRELALDECVRLSQYHSEYGVLLNSVGTRFCDESIADWANANATFHQQEPWAVLLYDSSIRDRVVANARVPGTRPRDPVTTLTEAGVTVLEGEDLDALASDLEATYGLPKSAVESSVKEYNAGHWDQVPRKRNRYQLKAPPYFAVKVEPTITSSGPGILVNSACSITDADAHPIPGLFAAGVDVGAFYTRYYLGGLSMALGTGRLAGEGAAAAAVG